jgi:CHAT domain-containing protein/Tfp pilus assembly protein PilF
MRQRWLRAALAGAVLLAVGLAPAQEDAEAAIRALYRRGETLKRAGKRDEARQVYEQALENARQAFGAGSLQAATLMGNLGVLYFEMGRYAKAELLLQRGLEIREKDLGKDHPSLALSLGNLAQVHQARGRYEKAEGLLQRALRIQESRLRKNHPDLILTLNNLAVLYQAMGRHERALPLFQRSLRMREARFGEDSPQVALALANLAALYKDMAQYEKAESLHLRSLRIREEELGEDDPETANSLNNLALLYQAMGRYEKARPLYLRAIRIGELRLGKGHPTVALWLNNLALLDQLTGRYQSAEPLFRRSLEILEAGPGKDHPDVARALSNLALLYWNMGQYARALPLFQRSLKICEAQLDRNHPHLATLLNNLALLYLDMGQPEKAEPLFQRSLETYEARLGADHPETATALNNLALLYRGLGRFARAEPLSRRALTIQEARLDRDHPEVVRTLNTLALLHLDTGNPDKARPLLERALQAGERQLGKSHPLVTTVLNNLALLAARKGGREEAFRLFDRARRGDRLHLAAVLPALADSEKKAFFENTGTRTDLEAALSLGLASKGEPPLDEQSASWLLNAKALDQEVLASSLLLSRQGSDPTHARLAARLLSVRQQLARQTLTVPGTGQEKQRLAALEALTEQEQELGKQLRQLGSKAVVAPWVAPAEVRKALPADAVLVDIAHFHRIDFKAKAGKQLQEAHYAAWVTPKVGPVRLIDLGPAEKIDAAIQRFRETMQGAAKQIKDRAGGEDKAEQALREHLDELAKRVLQPLLPHIGKAKRWLVSPDGNLWLVPWEALTLKDGTYAIEKYHISYLTSGRDLLPSAAAKVKRSAPLVLADPDFDLDPDRVRAEAKRLLGTGADEEATRALSGAFRLGAVRRLAGTAAEARAITPSLKLYAGVAPRVCTQTEALEAVFKAARNPRVVVLCTHGFFLPDQEVSRDDKGGAGTSKPVKRWENPLLRCGLLLAGCNNAAKASDGDDGVLTGLEVVGTDLRGCELVVLSACDTGVGEVQTGEGVSGLRQAFQLAGAQAVVSTLWQVPDRASARLMALFFQNLSAGKMSKAEALRAAKLKLIAERREDYASAHPFFWAAFTLTGEPGFAQPPG